MAADDTPRNADFIGRVVKDAKNPPETRVLTGWFGDAADEGYRRLYTDAELSAYVDIPADAILHTEPIRDSQPAGGVFVWVQRDAQLKYGGSASSRAARFLQGQVQQDFASAAGEDPGALEKAGMRCVTQAPCGEVTGFTGRCTKQPVVGGAWPCITAIPHCSEPTGFTGQCTNQPWPNPTQYVGCTIYHCPTRDLTHIQQICNIVATGMPGCPVVDPLGGGGDPAAKASAEAVDAGGGSPAVAPAPPVPATSIPGCGYTQTWGLCPTRPPKCAVSIDIPCIPRTEMPQQCGGGVNLAAGPASQICATNIACDVTLLCPNAAFRAVGPAIPIDSQVVQCTQNVACRSAVDACPTRLGCDTKQPTVYCTQTPEACPAVSRGIIACTQPPVCPMPSLGIACTLQCPTRCGADCQTQQNDCTQVNCQTNVQLDCTFGCTQAGTGCPATSIDVNCNANVAAAQPQAFRAVGPRSDLVACTQSGPQCPTQPNGDCTFFGCPTGTIVAAAGPIGCTQSGAQCPTQPNGDCTFFGGCPTDARLRCTLVGAGCPPTPATVCTQSGPQCPTQPNGDCTFFGGCPPTPATVCTQSGPQCPPLASRFQAFCPPSQVVVCPLPNQFVAFTRTFHCGAGPSAVDACPTRLCGGGVAQARFGAARQPEPTPATVCFICTQVPAFCPVNQ